MKKGLVALFTAMSLIASQLSFAAVTTQAESTAKQMEYLDRGTVAVKVSGGVYISWRLLGTENYIQAFDVYRDGTKIATVSDTTNYTDTRGTVDNKYTVVVSGENYSTGKTVSVWAQQYLSIPITAPEYSCTFEGTEYNFTYSANDASCADLDGDGEYEIILKWDPSGSFDSGSTHSGPSGNVFIDAYKLDGRRLWRMDLGVNISAGAHFTQFAAYDFDLDGKGEIAFKTAPGSKDGKGNYVSAASSINAIKNTTNNETDYRQSDGRVMQGDEYYTVFDGETGAALDTIYYPHPRDCHDSDWGDNGGRWNRSERFLSTVAYLDGVRPSIIAWRGYYDKTTVTAYNLVNDKLVQIADFDTDSYTGVNSNKEITGQGNHNTAIGDVDGDGKDEILSGGICLDDDFSVLWTTEKGHGDALHLADYDPTHDGMEYFVVHEHAPYGMSVIYPEDGEIVYHQDGGGDTGRGIMANYNGNGYYQIWGAGTDYKDANGFNNYNASGSLTSKSANFRIFWDGDVYDELMDGTGSSDCWMGIESAIGDKTGRITTLESVTNNYTKRNPCLQADLLGDWREEVVMRNGDSTALNLYTTTFTTTEKLYTLMHDGAYRMQVAGQNSAYNQPPHIGYYVSPDNDKNDMREYASYIKTIHNGETAVRTENIPSAEPTPTKAPTETDTITFTATKSRNEIGTGASNEATDRVWINYYNNTWGAAYFGFSGIENFDPSLVESAVIKFTPISYNTTNKSRQFFFDLFGTDDNSWETGVVTVSADPYPSDATKISSTQCYTNYGSGDVLVPGSAASFDVTSYVKSLAKGTTDMSFIVAVPSGSGGVGACELLMYNNPTLEIEVSKPELTATPTPTSAVSPTPTPTLENTQTFDEDVAVVEASGVTTWDTGSLDGWFLHRNDANGTVQVTDGRINVRVVSNNKTYLGLHADTVANSANKFVTFGFDYETSSVSTGNNQCTEIAVLPTDIDDVTWNTWNGNGAVLKTCETGMAVNTVYHIEFTIDNIEHTINYRITDSAGNTVEEKSLTNAGSGDINTIVFRTGKGVTDNIDNFYYSVESPVTTTPTPSPTPTVKPTTAPTVAPTVVPTPGVPDRAIFTTYDATEITSDSAMLNGYCEIIRGNGVLNVDFAGIFYYWEKGNSEEIKSTPYSGFLYSSSSYSYPISGLKPSTTYVYRLNDGNEVEFTTLASSSSTPIPTSAPTPSPTPTVTPTVAPTTSPTSTVEPTTAPSPTPTVEPDETFPPFNGFLEPIGIYKNAITRIEMYWNGSYDDNVGFRISPVASDDPNYIRIYGLKLIFAEYDNDNNLISVKLIDGNPTVDGSFNFDMPAPTSENYKIMIWDWDNDCAPIINPITS